MFWVCLTCSILRYVLLNFMQLLTQTLIYHNNPWWTPPSATRALGCQNIVQFIHRCPCFACALSRLSHWGRGKMADIFQITFSNAFSRMKIYEFRSNFHWSLFLRVQLTIFQHWFRYWPGADQAVSHYVNHWWWGYRRIYASLGLSGLNHSNAENVSIWWRHRDIVLFCGLEVVDFTHILQNYFIGTGTI